MDVIHEIESVVKILSKIDEYDDSLSNKLSYCDMATCDILHYIENEKMDAVKMCKVIRELKRIRIDRRKIKNDMVILRTFNNNKVKLTNTSNLKFLMNEISKTNNHLKKNIKIEFIVMIFQN